MRIAMVLAVLAFAGAATPSAAQPYVARNPGQAANVTPDSRDYRAADKAFNHPKKNHRHRVCKYHRDARHQMRRHCTWK